MQQTNTLRVHLLGGFRVEIDSRTVVEVGRSTRAAALLKLLVLSPGRQLHTEQVVDRLWGELDTPSALNNLHVTIYTLRHLLEPELPRGRQSRFVTLNLGVLSLSAGDGVWVDVDEFQHACHAARCDGTIAAYETAIELYAGDLLPGDPYLEIAAGPRELLRQTYLSLLLELADLYERQSDLPNAIRVMHRLVAVEPTHEHGQASLMRLYAVAGQRSQALRQYQLTVRMLRTELDSEPCSETIELYRAIRSGQIRGIDPVSPLTMHAVASARGELTRRELEIAALVAGGRTNREIAVRLGISVRTADTHVGRLLRKLGLSSRQGISGARTYTYGHIGIFLSRG